MHLQQRWPDEFQHIKQKIFASVIIVYLWLWPA
jgi:hypothetical protein